MDDLRRQVRRAQWWLGVQRFVEALGWCLFGTLLAAAVLILIDKYVPLGLQPWAWPAGALGLGLAAAAGWAIWRSRGAIDAAIEIDRRFGLKERVSSTLAMSDEERQSEIGEALVSDAIRRVERIDVHEHFTVTPGRQLLLPLAPAILAFLVAVFVNPAVDNSAEGMTDSLAAKKQIDTAKKSLQIQLAERREEARKEGLKDAQKLLTKLQDELDKLTAKAAGDKQEAMLKLNDLASQLEKRSRELGGAEAIEKQLRQLKDLEKGPAEKFLQALRRGDLANAAKELKDLKEKLEAGKLNPEEQRKLAQQAQQLQKNLENLVNAHQQAMQNLEKRINELRQQGKNDEANKLQQELAKLQNQLPQMNNLQQMAGKLGQAAQKMQNGQLKEAAAMINGMAGDLKDLDQQLKEFQLLKEAIEQLEQARRQMGCEACGGAGCERCGKPGMGLGAGRGQGPRPEQAGDTNYFDTQAATKPTPGAADYDGQTDGPNKKGDFQQALIQSATADKPKDADPLGDMRIHRKYRKHYEEYFNMIRDGN
jgi:hypothetical protein